MSSFVQEHLVGRVDFLKFYRDEGVTFRGKRGLCPFYEDTDPSFDVDLERGESSSADRAAPEEIRRPFSIGVDPIKSV